MRPLRDFRHLSSKLLSTPDALKQSRNHPDAQVTTRGDKSLGLIAPLRLGFCKPFKGRKLSHREVGPSQPCKLACGGQAAGSGGARRGAELDKELRFLAKQEKVQELPTTKTETFPFGILCLGSQGKDPVLHHPNGNFSFTPLHPHEGCSVPGKSKQKVTC